MLSSIITAKKKATDTDVDMIILGHNQITSWKALLFIQNPVLGFSATNSESILGRLGATSLSCT